METTKALAKLHRQLCPPTKAQAKLAKRTYKAALREAQPSSMMNMTRATLRGIISTDYRTRLLFAAYRRRVAAKQELSAARG